jgi:hypothetical protein
MPNISPPLPRQAEIIDFELVRRLPPGPRPYNPQEYGAMMRVGERARKNTERLREEEIERRKNDPPGSVGAQRVPRPDDEEDEPEPSQPKVAPLPISDFIAHSPDHSYIYRPTGEEWTATAVNARVMPVDVGDEKPLPANVWLDRNHPVEQRTWTPGEPQIIKDKLVAEGGFFPKRGARVFNLYKPPRS